MERFVNSVEFLPVENLGGKLTRGELHIVHQERVGAPDAYVLIRFVGAPLNHCAGFFDPFGIADGCVGAGEHFSKFVCGIAEYKHVDFGSHCIVVAERLIK